MKRLEIFKRYEFVTLCSKLTKEGFNFSIDKTEKYTLIFDKQNHRSLFNLYTKLPFVESVCFNVANNKFKVYFIQTTENNYINQLNDIIPNIKEFLLKLYK